jgi:hypothetical protein
MHGVKDEALSTVKDYFKSLRKGRKDDQEVLVWLYTFDTTYNVIWDGVDLDVPDLKRIEYEPGGMTALYDALGRCVLSMEKVAKPKDRVLIVTMTDGQENSSREFTSSSIKALVEKHSGEKSKWSFVYLGADESAYHAATAIGYRANQILAVDMSSPAQFKNVSRGLTTSNAAYMGDVNMTGAGYTSTISSSLEEQDKLTTKVKSKS